MGALRLSSFFWPEEEAAVALPFPAAGAGDCSRSASARDEDLPRLGRLVGGLPEPDAFASSTMDGERTRFADPVIKIRH